MTSGGEGTAAKPRLALVSMYFEPETTGSAPYISDTARYLAESGYEVHVYTTWPHYPSWRARRAGVEGPHPDHPGLTVHRARTFVPSRPTAFSRFLYEFLFACRAFTAVLRQGNFDLYCGCSPNLFSAVLARILGKLRKRPVLTLVQDIVSSAPRQTGQSALPGGSYVLERLERWALSGSRWVVIPTEGFVQPLQRLQVPRDRLRVVRNWSHVTPPVQPVAPTPGLILHTGNIGQKQGLDLLADAVKRATCIDPRLSFRFVGDGNRRSQLAEAIAGSRNVTIEPPVDSNSYMELLCTADVLLVHERPGVLDMSLPSKLTSYFAAGRPIVAVVEPGGVTAAEIRLSGAGIVLPHDQLDNLADTLSKLIDDPSTARDMGARGLAHRQKYLDPQVGLAAIEALVRDTLAVADPRIRQVS